MLPYIRPPSAAPEGGCPATVAPMPTPHRWSLLVPVLGVLGAIALLPVTSLPTVPDALREPVSYLATWVPLGVAAAISVRLAVRRRAEAWWRALRLGVGPTALLVSLFAGLLLRTVAVGAEALVTGRIGAGSLSPGGGQGDAVALVAVVAASAIVSPVIEELFFRGTLLPAVGERIGTGRAADGVAIVLAAAVFAVVHALAGSSLISVVVAFVAGIGFGLVARSHGVGAAIIAHVVFNATGLALIAAAGGLSPVYPTLSLG
jgi:membrane protease YdiL (CAAX protease family)